MVFNIIQDKKSEGRITFSKGLVNKLKTGFSNKIKIRFGSMKSDAQLVFDDAREDDIWISQDVIDKINLPIDLQYQVNFLKDEISIGPVIGLLLYQNEDYYTSRKLEKFMEYALGYNEIKGLLCLMSEENIDFLRNQATGFYYKPGKDGSKHEWIKGKFPIPGAIFRRVGLSPVCMKNLINLTDNKVFNSYYFDKLEFWNICRNNPKIINNIPNTRELKSFSDVEKMLSKFESVFLKPVTGSLGNGVLKVVKMNNLFTVQGKFDEKPLVFEDKDMFKAFIMNYISGYSFIVQQDINLVKYDGGYVDFRVIMQKDYTQGWNCTGIVTCVGPNYGIHSNYTDEGRYMSFEDFMKQKYDFKDSDIFAKRMEYINLCKNVCSALDETGENYCDLGIDVGLDESLKPWVFEANKSQFFYVPLMIGDNNAYYAARTNPVRYAAAQCGFNFL